MIEHKMYEAKQTNYILVLGHSAGRDMHDVCFANLASHLEAFHISLFALQFPYRSAGRKIAEPVHKSVPAFSEAIKELRSWNVPLFIGGKSYGGRVASHFLETPHPLVSGLICLSFPLKTKKITDTSRGAHLTHLSTPTLILQGERDSMGTATDFNGLLPRQGQIHGLAYADHSLQCLKRHPTTQDNILAQAAVIIANWIKKVAK